MAKKPTKPSRRQGGRKPAAAGKASKARTKAKAPARRPAPAKARKAAPARQPAAKRPGGKAPLSPKVEAWVRLQAVELRAAEPGLGPDALVARINELLAAEGLPPLLPIFIQPLIDWPRE